jgi:hypothetical protein
LRCYESISYPAPHRVVGVVEVFYLFFKKFFKKYEVYPGVSRNKVDNPYNPVNFHTWGRDVVHLCIIMSMNKYVYQISGALESRQGQFLGLRVLVCDVYNFDSVDVPVEVLDSETAKYLQFRLSITAESLDIQKLPVEIQNKIRTPLGRWLDFWVLENFYGDSSTRKNTNA